MLSFSPLVKWILHLERRGQKKLLQCLSVGLCPKLDLVVCDKVAPSRQSYVCMSIISVVFEHILMKKTAFLLLLPSPCRGDAISKSI